MTQKRGSCIPWNPTSLWEAHGNVFIRNDLPSICRGLFPSATWGRTKPWGVWTPKWTISTQLGRGHYMFTIFYINLSPFFSWLTVDHFDKLWYFEWVQLWKWPLSSSSICLSVFFFFYIFWIASRYFPMQAHGSLHNGAHVKIATKVAGLIVKIK